LHDFTTTKPLNDFLQFCYLFVWESFHELAPVENDKVMFRLITNFHPLFLCLQNQFLNLILISLRDDKKGKC
jgi:hypothetical protein